MAHDYPYTWYWQVDDSTPATTRWQASSGAFVATSNADYLAFLAEGNAPSEIDTFVNLCKVIDDWNATLVPPGYLAVSSGVSFQMLNTPPLVFDFTPTAGGLTLTLPQVNLFGSLAKGRLLIVRNGSATIPFTISRFGALTLNPGVVPVNGFVVLQLSDNSTQGGVFRPAFWLQARYETHGNTNDTLVAAAAAVVVYANNAALSAPRTWTLPAANTFIPGQLLMIVDEHGGVSATNTLSVARAGVDTINGVATSIVLNRAFDFTLLETDGVSQFTIVGGKGALASTDLSDLPIPATSGGTGVAYLPLQGFIAGLTLSNDAGTPNTIIDIAAGMCCSDDATTMMKLAAFTKTTGAWAVGTGNGGLDTGAVANSTWYHVFVIERTDTGVVDALISISATAPTMPANYTKKRRTGSIKTDGAANILAFVQDGDIFRWDLPIADVNAANPGTAAVTRTLTVPTGVQVYADMAVAGQNTGNSLAPAAIYISDLALTDRAAAFPIGTFYVVSQITETLGILTNLIVLGGPVQCRTNTSAQVRSRCQISDANTTLFISTLGWTDRRGAR